VYNWEGGPSIIILTLPPEIGPVCSYAHRPNSRRGSHVEEAVWAGRDHRAGKSDSTCGKELDSRGDSNPHGFPCHPLKMRRHGLHSSITETVSKEKFRPNIFRVK